MPSNQLYEEQRAAELSSQAASVPVVFPPAEKFIPLKRARDLYRRVKRSAQGFSLENLLSEMQVELRVGTADVARIPRTGPVVVVANHPLGMLDGAVLAVLLARVRPDVKVMTNYWLRDVPELAQHCIFVDPVQNQDEARSTEINLRALREALAWLRGGGMLGIFPAGEVSHLHFHQRQITDPTWTETAARLIRQTKATAVPIYFCGRNSVGFHLFGMIHPPLKTAFLLQEFLQQRGRAVEVRVGSEIPSDFITGIEDRREATEYLRWRTYLLAQRSQPQKLWPISANFKIPAKLEPIASAQPPQELMKEIDSLPADRCLAQNGELAVFLAKAHETPQMLREVGRLRETTFRGVDEGTGKSVDLDRFDDYYWHLLLWNRRKHELVGGYRAGSTSEILAEYGVNGLYTNTLFRYDMRLFDRLGPALELGRSFIRVEYQKQYAPLLLLWKGIARLIASHAETAVLFGAVSISNDYCKASREMIYRFFKARMRDDELAEMIEPRRPFRPLRLRPWDCRAMNRAMVGLEDLSQPIADLETDGKGLPILLRQYAKIGGKLLGFNVDRKFSNVLDGLVVVDLRETDSGMLERYLGREAAAEFRAKYNL